MFVRMSRRLGVALAGSLLATTAMAATAVTTASTSVAATATTTLTGVVKNKSGLPLAGMTVRVSPAAGGQVMTAKTATNGTYTLSNLPSAESYVTAGDETGRVLAGETTYAGAYWNGTSTPTYGSVVLAPGTFTANFTLPRKTGIVAKAVDAGTGAPLQNITWSGQIFNESTGAWQNLARSTQSTYETGKTFWNTDTGKKHRFCFSDNNYGEEWKPTYRYATACWNGATSFATATTLSPAAEQTVAITVPMTKAGKSLYRAGQSVHGDPAVGGRLTAEPGTWSPAPVTLKYQWIHYNGSTRVAIPGATTASLVPTEALRGKDVHVEVTASKSGYVSRTDTLAGGTIGGKTPTLASFTVTGARSVGSVLTANVGAVSPSTAFREITWRANGVRIPGVYDTNTYTITSATYGKVISADLRVYAWQDGSYANERHAFAYVAGLLTASTPIISGTRTVGATLTASAGTWSPAPVTLTYQWRRDGAAISGATASTFVTTAADNGKSLTVTVTGTKARHTTQSRTSAAVTIGGITAGTPTIFGPALPQVKSGLTVVPGTWGPAPVALTYQWYRGTTAITGATNSFYSVGEADRGHQIRAAVTGAKAGFPSRTAYTPFTATVGLGGTVDPPPGT